MANSPSSNGLVSRSHVRRPTPIFPALPLSLSDKTWRRPSEIPQSILTEVANNATASQASQNVDDQTDDKTSLTKNIAGEETSKTEAIQGTQDLSSDTSSHKRKEGTITFHEEQNGSEARPSQAAHIEYKPQEPNQSRQSDNTIETSSQQSHYHTHQDSDVSELQRNDALNTTVIDGVKSLRMSNHESSPVDHEISSVEPSSTTVATDHSSYTNESTLETVVDEDHELRRHVPVQHRKSEAAPEALANGFSPRSVQGSNSSQAVGAVQTPPRMKQALLPSIHDHLLLMANSKQFFDTILYVNHPDHSLQASEHFAHLLLLSRSERFTKLMSDIDTSAQPKMINLYPCRNILSHAFEAALRFLYSDQVLNIQTLMPQAAYQDSQAKRHAFEYVMSYWISGVELGLPPIKSRSYEMVQDLLGWDLADLVAREVQNLRSAEENSTNALDKIEIHDIANSLTRLMARRLFVTLDLSTIDLSNMSQATPLTSRFAALEYPRSNNPSLSSMVFGSLPSEPSTGLNPASIVAAILLNCAFIDLAIMAEEFLVTRGPLGEHLLRNVVSLREERRENVIDNRAISNKQRNADLSAWEAAAYREYVNEFGHLARDRVGFLMPTRTR